MYMLVCSKTFPFFKIKRSKFSITLVGSLYNYTQSLHKNNVFSIIYLNLKGLSLGAPPNPIDQHYEAQC